MTKKTENKKKNKEMQNKINLFLLKYFSFIVVFIIILLLYAGYLYIVKIKQDNIRNNIEVANEDKENYKIILQKKLEKLQEYRLEYESVSQTEKEKISVMIPEKANKNLLFTNVETFILRQGLILDSIGIDEKNQAINNSRSRNVEASGTSSKALSGVDEIKIGLEISGVGGYEHFKKVLFAFEKNLQILDINKLDFDMETGVLNLTVTTYYLKDK